MSHFAVPLPSPRSAVGLSEDELVPYSVLNEEAEAVPIGCEGLVRPSQTSKQNGTLAEGKKNAVASSVRTPSTPTSYHTLLA